MFSVVDNHCVLIEQFEDYEDAVKFCEWWNTRGRFNEWGEPIAHIIGGA